MTDNQLYERVGQADAVYIERETPDLLGLISTRGYGGAEGGGGVLRRIMRRMKEGQSRLYTEHGDFWQREKVSDDIYRSKLSIYVRHGAGSCSQR